MTRIGSGKETSLAALLSDLADVAYFRVDADRNVVEVSPAMERLTGFRAEEVLGRSCLRLHRCEECLRGCGVFDNLEIRDKCIELYRADGSVVEVRKSGRVLFDEDGAIGGALEVVRPAERDEVRDETREPDTAPPTEEARRITEALERTRYNRTAAARLLGMSRTSLWRKMREYGL